MSSLRKLSKTALLITVPVFLFLGALEVGLRVLTMFRPDPVFARTLRDYQQLDQDLAESFRFVPGGELSYKLKPNFRAVAPDGGVTEHNSAGFRTQPFPAPPLDETTFRVLCIGASTTYGVGATQNADTYPAHLEVQLAQRPLTPPFDMVQVFNLGVGGYTTLEMKETLRQWIGPLQPHAVIIHCGINDVAPRLFEVNPCDYSHFRLPLRLPQPSHWQRPFHNFHFIMYPLYISGAVHPLTLQNLTQRPLPPAAAAQAGLETNGAQCFRQNVQDMVDLTIDAGARPWLVTQSYLEHPDFAAPHEEDRAMEALYRAGSEEHNAVLRTLAQETPAGLVDIAADMPQARWLFVDPIHLNRDGNAVKARLISDAMYPAP